MVECMEVGAITERSTNNLLNTSLCAPIIGDPGSRRKLYYVALIKFETKIGK